MVDSDDYRVLVCAPGRDSALTCEILKRAGIACTACRSGSELVSQARHGVGAIIYAEELLAEDAEFSLDRLLNDQPPWSDLPVFIVAAAGQPESRLADYAKLRSVCVLSRPMAIDNLVTALQAALQARHRQYEVRDLLNEREEAAKRKDGFLAMLAHELRNPLAPVRYGVEILRHKVANEDLAAIEAVSLVERQLTHLSRLIDDLLDVSRITNGAISLKQETLELGALVQQVVETRRLLANEKGLSIELEQNASSIWVLGDSVRLTQILDNLLDNAVKFSAPGGSIVVSIERAATTVSISVRDDGEGIEQETLGRLFGIFEQADRSLDRSKGGLGLGLAIVSSLAALHQGSVSAASEGARKGATFTLTLPLHETMPKATAQPAFDNLSCSQNQRVLVIEDNRASADTLAMLLRLHGNIVEVVYDGHAGVEKAREFTPHLILCDIGLPGLSGYEVAHALREDGSLRRVRLVAITGYGGEECRRAVLSAGFDAHFVKPVSPSDLLEQLQLSKSSDATNDLHIARRAETR